MRTMLPYCSYKPESVIFSFPNPLCVVFNLYLNFASDSLWSFLKTEFFPTSWLRRALRLVGPFGTQRFEIGTQRFDKCLLSSTFDGL
jgi:hypothetical protein